MTAMKQPLGTLLVVSGPSGSGKTTLCRRATENGLCVYSISCTTRQPRPGEVNGVDYHFLTPAEFDARVERGDFLEYAEVHGNRYGTLKADILTLLEQGKNVVMDIDVQGAGQVRSCREGILPLCYADVYIYVPQAELKNRLCGRQTDGAETIALRLRNAEQMTLGSLVGTSAIFIPVISSRCLYSVGTSCPSSSSLSIVSCSAWKSKCVVIISLSVLSAGC